MKTYRDPGTGLIFKTEGFKELDDLLGKLPKEMRGKVVHPATRGMLGPIATQAMRNLRSQYNLSGLGSYRKAGFGGSRASYTEFRRRTRGQTGPVRRGDYLVAHQNRNSRHSSSYDLSNRADKFYLYFLEFGTVRGIEPGAWMRKAFMAKRMAGVQNSRKAFARGLDRAVERLKKGQLKAIKGKLR